MKQLDWFDFHERGDLDCPACVTPPTICQDCGGLVHTQFGGDLDELESKCDNSECVVRDVQVAVGE